MVGREAVRKEEIKKILTRSGLLKEVKPSSDLKMIKLLTFVKLFPSQEHLPKARG